VPEHELRKLGSGAMFDDGFCGGMIPLGLGFGGEGAGAGAGCGTVVVVGAGEGTEAGVAGAEGSCVTTVVVVVEAGDDVVTVELAMDDEACCEGGFDLAATSRALPAESFGSRTSELRIPASPAVTMSASRGSEGRSSRSGPLRRCRGGS
jgi:hypothetical protein